VKKIVFVLCLSIVIISILSVSLVSAANKIRIGFSQIIEHPALDAVRQGVIDELRDAGYVEGENVIYVTQNAQGDYLTAIAIAQSFALEKLDVIVCISTPSAQAMAQQIKDIPIVASAVTDFVEAGLVKNYEAYNDPSGNRNITGVSDMIPVQQQFELIKKLCPHVKTVGVIYNPGEANSAHLTEIAKNTAKEMGLKVLEALAVNTADVALAAQSLKGRVECIWVSTDNLVVSALSIVARIALENGIILVNADPTFIHLGPVASLGFDYYVHGRMTGRIVLRILNCEKPNQIPIQFMTNSKDLFLSVNADSAQLLGLDIPADVLEQANELVYGGYKWTKSE
jgi:putative ABC transport system substrate-binding protein